MIKIENMHTDGFDAAIRGMRNPMNSWDKSDSVFRYHCSDISELGENDLTLMQKLIKAGTDHSKFMRMINVTMDITAPLYWWKEYDTHKVGTVTNSCSTMHKIAAKEFTIDDFSHEHLTDIYSVLLEQIVVQLNGARNDFIDTKNKHDWWQLIQLLPSSYNQRRTVQLNFAVLRNIYFSRRNHKLDEWVNFCDFISKHIPYTKELICLE